MQRVVAAYQSVVALLERSAWLPVLGARVSRGLVFFLSGCIVDLVVDRREDTSTTAETTMPVDDTTMPVDDTTDGMIVCAAEEELCDDTCVSPAEDPDNCGRCGEVCADDEGCLAGTCMSCRPGTTNCDRRCVDLLDDDDHCGDCNVACKEPMTCVAGECQPV